MAARRPFRRRTAIPKADTRRCGSVLREPTRRELRRAPTTVTRTRCAGSSGSGALHRQGAVVKLLLKPKRRIAPMASLGLGVVFVGLAVVLAVRRRGRRRRRAAGRHRRSRPLGHARRTDARSAGHTACRGPQPRVTAARRRPDSSSNGRRGPECGRLPCRPRRRRFVEAELPVPADALRFDAPTGLRRVPARACRRAAASSPGPSWAAAAARVRTV